MSKSEKLEKNASAVADFLTRHRMHPPERDGWYSGYEIQSGMRAEGATGVRASHIYLSVDYLTTVMPPAVEDTWMMTRDDGLPDTSNHYEHPNQPKHARRFYRALGNARNYIVMDAPALGSTNLAH